MSFSREARMTGVRGGKSEFNWDDVRDGKHGRADDYLGACMKASKNGRRDRDRDFFWYNKRTDTLGRGVDRDPALVKAARRLEVLERRKADAFALADALGETAETRRRADELDLEASELRSLLERGGTERDQLLSTERVAGLGAAPTRRHADASARVVAEEQRQAEVKRKRDLVEADAARRACRDPRQVGGQMNDGGFLTADGAAPAAGGKDRRAAKRARKEDKKRRKKEKKAAKKASKRARRSSSGS
jgi:hypothetical protein